MVSESYAGFGGSQLAYLLGRNSHYELGGISTHAYFEFETTLDMVRLNASLNKVIELHPMLRAVILGDGTRKILEQIPVYKIAVQDISSSDNSEKDKIIERERSRMSHHIFDAQQWPLFEFKALKLSAEKHYLFISIDLLIVDGASILSLIKDIMKFYREPEQKAVPHEFTFRDYVIASGELTQTEMYAKDRDFWLAGLDTFPSAPRLPLQTDPACIAKP